VSTPEKILRKRDVLQRIPVGRTKFEADIAPRLVKVRLGERSVGYTESSTEKLIAALIAESVGVPSFVPAPNRPRQKVA
jgi:predicted DNA-binding transcriptional regulator AlpA